MSDWRDKIKKGMTWERVLEMMPQDAKCEMADYLFLATLRNIRANANAMDQSKAQGKRRDASLQAAVLLSLTAILDGIKIHAIQEAIKITQEAARNVMTWAAQGEEDPDGSRRI